VVAPAPKLAFDTNLYIGAMRDEAARAKLSDFAAQHAPRCHLVSLVAMELLAGVRSSPDARRLHQDLVRPFERRGRLLSPSAGAVLKAGGVLASLRREGDLPRDSLPASFLSDVLIALTCVEAGVLLLTHNLRDFERIGRHVSGLQFADF